MEWHPIETAPSGGAFIVCMPNEGIGARSVALAYRAVNGTIRSESGAFDYTRRATHWMPLPTPPKPESGS